MPTPEGTLKWEPLLNNLDLVAPAVAASVGTIPEACVARIDPGFADTAAFCAAYDVALEKSANCVLIVGARAGEIRHAAVMVLATMRADVNGAVRRELDVRKCSFAPMEQAVSMTGMEYGGITPIGLPVEWRVLVDEAVLRAGHVVVGSGLRGSKLLLPSSALLRLPSARQGFLSK